jgi:hypothetical protein
VVSWKSPNTHPEKSRPGFAGFAGFALAVLSAVLSVVLSVVAATVLPATRTAGP